MFIISDICKGDTRAPSGLTVQILNRHYATDPWVASFLWVASFDGLWPFWQPTTAYKHIILYVIDVFANGK